MLKYDVEKKADAVIISIDGDLYLNDIKNLDSVFKKNITPEIRVAALDLKYMHYLDSFVISRILKVLKELTKKEIEFILIDMNDNIFQIFIAGTFDRIFNIMTREEFFSKYISSERSDRIRNKKIEVTSR